MKFRTLILLLFVFISTTVVAQFSGMGGMSRSSATTEEHHDSPKIKQFRGDVFRGLSVHADVASPIVSLLGGYARSYEVQLDVNLYRRLFPIFEIGYATANKEAMSGIVYNTKAPFFRLGLNYNLLKPFGDDDKSRSVQCYPFVGVRYAMSPTLYNISNIVVDDPYWGTSHVRDFHDVDYVGWVEVVGGVRVDLFKGLTLGWSIRLKTLLHTSASNKAYVWYVPGYGKTSNMGVMFNYTIGYTFYCGKDTK
jgi:hypothetical protein